MCPLLHAFSLHSKAWVAVSVDSVAPVVFHSNAFDHLVANQKHKTQLLSLVKSRLNTASDLVPSDPIPDKGRGLLVLLSGPPGTGKTLMAESIAERAARPLYYVDARDLGTTITEIATKFTIIMENAREWRAIVLLDEADIYLQKRYGTADSQTSDRTTAFLRQLEYFQGTLFLTTNVPETIDEAIKSRIHITIPFPRLPHSYRTNIWAHFLDAVPAAGKQITSAQVTELGRWKINGRQIKNAFRNCVALCQEEQKIMTMERLEDMIGMSCESAVKEPLGPGSSTQLPLLETENSLEPTEELELDSTSGAERGRAIQQSIELPRSSRLADGQSSPALASTGQDSRLTGGTPSPASATNGHHDPDAPQHITGTKRRPLTPAKPPRLLSIPSSAKDDLA